MAMPRRAGGSSLTLAPPIRRSPELMSSSPAISRKSVDLPHPDGPTNTVNERSGTVISTPATTSSPPKNFRTRLSSTSTIPHPLTAPAVRPETIFR
jgi:hypothetical protein